MKNEKGAVGGGIITLPSGKRVKRVRRKKTGGNKERREGDDHNINHDSLSSNQYGDVSPNARGDIIGLGHIIQRQDQGAEDDRVGKDVSISNQEVNQPVGGPAPPSVNLFAGVPTHSKHDDEKKNFDYSSVQDVIRLIGVPTSFDGDDEHNQARYDSNRNVNRPAGVPFEDNKQDHYGINQDINQPVEFPTSTDDDAEPNQAHFSGEDSVKFPAGVPTCCKNDNEHNQAIFGYHQPVNQPVGVPNLSEDDDEHHQVHFVNNNTANQAVDVPTSSEDKEEHNRANYNIEKSADIKCRPNTTPCETHSDRHTNLLLPLESRAVPFAPPVPHPSKYDDICENDYGSQFQEHQIQCREANVILNHPRHESLGKSGSHFSANTFEQIQYNEFCERGDKDRIPCCQNHQRRSHSECQDNHIQRGKADINIKSPGYDSPGSSKSCVSMNSDELSRRGRYWESESDVVKRGEVVISRCHNRQEGSNQQGKYIPTNKCSEALITSYDSPNECKSHITKKYYKGLAASLSSEDSIDSVLSDISKAIGDVVANKISICSVGEMLKMPTHLKFNASSFNDLGENLGVPLTLCPLATECQQNLLSESASDVGDSMNVTIFDTSISKADQNHFPGEGTSGFMVPIQSCSDSESKVNMSICVNAANDSFHKKIESRQALTGLSCPSAALSCSTERANEKITPSTERERHILQTNQVENEIMADSQNELTEREDNKGSYRDISSKSSSTNHLSPFQKIFSEANNSNLNDCSVNAMMNFLAAFTIDMCGSSAKEYCGR